jgi:hypothetical protein
MEVTRRHKVVPRKTSIFESGLTPLATSRLHAVSTGVDERTTMLPTVQTSLPVNSARMQRSCCLLALGVREATDSAAKL